MQFIIYKTVFRVKSEETGPKVEVLQRIRFGRDRRHTDRQGGETKTHSPYGVCEQSAVANVNMITILENPSHIKVSELDSNQDYI